MYALQVCTLLNCNPYSLYIGSLLLFPYLCMAHIINNSKLHVSFFTCLLTLAVCLLADGLALKIISATSNR